MNTDLLLSWLGLPPGPWPPDDRALLGIGSQTLSSAEIEILALERMDRLRTHQLLHPELVTEGMNRLAQAMIALTATPAPTPRAAARSASESFSLEPEPSALPEFQGATVLELPTVPSTNRDPVPPVPSVPVIVDAELVAVEMPRVRVRPANKHVVEPESNTAPDYAESAAIISEAEIQPVTILDRRQAYRELAVLRRLRKAWIGLRSSVADPGAAIASPAEICEFWETTLQIRGDYPLLADSGAKEPGSLVWAVLRQPYPLGILRTLVPSQRRRLAQDWARGFAALEFRSATLRRGLAAKRQRRAAKRRILRLGWQIGRAPEFWLLVATALSLGIALIRRPGG